METLKRFIEKMKSDRSLLSQMVELKQKNDEAGMKQLMLDRGVTEEDFQEGVRYLNSLGTSQSEDLSDEQLDMIAGGKGCSSNVTIEGCLLMHTTPGNPIACKFVNTGLG